MSSDSPGAPQPEARASCPLCGAIVFPHYRKCEFCGSVLASHETAETAESERAGKDSELLSNLLLALPAIASVTLIAYVMPTHAMHRPQMKLWIVTGASFLLSAAIAAVDAQRLGAGRRPEAGTLPPAAWYAAFLFALPAALPMYMRQRASAGKPDRIAWAMGIGFLLFATIIATAAVATAKESKWLDRA